MIIQGGQYDLSNTFINYQFISSQIISQHEGIHRQLIASTFDGISQIIIDKAIKFYSNNSELSNEYKKLLIHIINESRFAHEVFATYLSVKLNDVSETNRLLAEHPAEYRKYYWYIEDSFGSNLKTSYVQYSVLHCIAALTLSSNFITRLIENNLDPNLKLLESEKTNVRLEKIVKVFKNDDTFLERVRELVFNKIKNQKLDPFDITSEEDWERANGDSKKLAELVM